MEWSTRVDASIANEQPYVTTLNLCLNFLVEFHRGIVVKIPTNYFHVNLVFGPDLLRDFIKFALSTWDEHYVKSHLRQLFGELSTDTVWRACYQSPSSFATIPR